MQVTSIEMMVDLPAGTVLDMTTSSGIEKWERAAQGGWVCIYRNSAAVPANARVAPIGERYFAGLMSGGQLRVARPPVPEFSVGQLLTAGRYTYLVHGIDDGRGQVACFDGARWIGPDSLDPGFLTRQDVREGTWENQDNNTWTQQVMAWATRDQTALRATRDRAVARYQQAERDTAAALEQARVANRERDALRTTQSRLPQNVIDRLHAYASEVEDETFEELLADIGIERTTEVTVTVRLTGSNFVTMSNREAAGSLGIAVGDVIEVDDSCRVKWRRTFDVTRSVQVGSCACDDVDIDDSDVQDQVPSDADESEIESSSCTND
jgi:hypothetical protein